MKLKLLLSILVLGIVHLSLGKAHVSETKDSITYIIYLDSMKFEEPLTAFDLQKKMKLNLFESAEEGSQPLEIISYDVIYKIDSSFFKMHIQGNSLNALATVFLRLKKDDFIQFSNFFILKNGVGEQLEFRKLINIEK